MGGGNHENGDKRKREAENTDVLKQGEQEGIFWKGRSRFQIKTSDRRSCFFLRLLQITMENINTVLVIVKSVLWNKSERS